MRPYRKKQVGSVIRHVVGEAIAHRLHDPRVAPLTTITRVDVTGDLSIARVFLSVQGNEAAERRTIGALRHARGFLQRELARELVLRQCPELHFEIDRAVKEARRTLELIEENRRREPELFDSIGPDAENPSDEATLQNPTRNDTYESRGVGE
jgi:ribosome-binding factor A